MNVNADAKVGLWSHARQIRATAGLPEVLDDQEVVRSLADILSRTTNIVRPATRR
jgi:hypothetical protein